MYIKFLLNYFMNVLQRFGPTLTEIIYNEAEESLSFYSESERLEYR